MRSLYLRIWLTVIVTLALFAGVSGWLVQAHLSAERLQHQAALNERLAAWGELIQRSLPDAGAPPQVQADALREWSQRLQVPMALFDAQGRRIAASDAYLRREREGGRWRAYQVRLDDGRTLWILRGGLLRPPQAVGLLRRGPLEAGGPPPGPWPGPGPQAGPAAGPGPAPGPEPPPDPDTLRAPYLLLPALRGLPPSVGLLALVAALFLAIAGGAYPFVRRLTRRLEALQLGVDAFGRGALDRRVPVEGRDEVASLAHSFNEAAERIETLVRAHKSLLANASHELRSPLARLKMATSMLSDPLTGDAERGPLRTEIDTDIAELDGLVDEVLLASRLEVAPTAESLEPVDLLALAVEEGARVGAQVEGEAAPVPGDERLLRRALRNLLENARRYGGGQITVELHELGPAGVEIRVLDNGPGVPEAYRERVFEPFFRLPGHAERAGGVGLGLALVRQIVERHHGRVRCERPAAGGGSFVIELPRPAAG